MNDHDELVHLAMRAAIFSPDAAVTQEPLEGGMARMTVTVSCPVEQGDAEADAQEAIGTVVEEAGAPGEYYVKLGRWRLSE